MNTWYYKNKSIINFIYPIVYNFILYSDKLKFKYDNKKTFTNFVLLLYERYYKDINEYKYIHISNTDADDYTYFDLTYNNDIINLFTEIKNNCILDKFTIFENKTSNSLNYFIFNNTYIDNEYDDYVEESETDEYTN